MTPNTVLVNRDDYLAKVPKMTVNKINTPNYAN